MSQYHACLVRQKFYLDSVALMRFSKSLAAMPGVDEAAMMMGTPSNIEIMSNAGLLDDAASGAAPGDLVIGIRGADEASVQSALAESSKLLDSPTSTKEGEQWRPKSIRSAVANNPNANLALISVPGPFAISEARKAVRRGLHVMIFSDNVDIEKEAELKNEAQSLGKLVMGPDCGTAIINGVPLAFANKVVRGDIGIIGASGTGIQEVSCLISQHGKGISQAIGVGGRDLQERVGGVSTLMAMEALEKDENTRHIVLISKPPAATVAERVLAKAASSNKTYTICFIGDDQHKALPSNCSRTNTLTEAACDALGISSLNATQAPNMPVNKNGAKLLRGLFCGGTLCSESLVICRQATLEVNSNVSMQGIGNLDSGHQLIDLGADEFTQGKPHPMIEPSIRNEAVTAALADESIGVLLVDVVIGFGAHADPASQLVLSLADNNRTDLNIIASVTGTDDDPQQRARQIAILRDAGIVVAASNAQATELALGCMGLSA